MTTAPAVVVTIAGSDCSGGAGIQADLKTIAALQCYGASAITALTAQNTTGVQDVLPVSPDFVKKQLLSILDDIQVSSFKIGMLHDSGIIREVASSLKTFYESKKSSIPSLVVDPVCVSTSGHTLLQTDAIDTLIHDLFPLATLITPNKSEAELLLTTKNEGKHFKINDLNEALAAVRWLSGISGTSGKCNVLLKGGHLSVTVREFKAFVESIPKLQFTVNVDWDTPSGRNMEILKIPVNLDDRLAVDILYEYQSDSCTVFARPHVKTTSTHGTGCTLSAAIACYVGPGCSVRRAVELATAYTQAGIENAFPLGSGHGPLNHLHRIQQRQVPLPTPSDPCPFTKSLIISNSEMWKSYVQHSFVRQLGEGTLDEKCFIHFIKQDYHYLKYYARAYGLLVAKSRSFEAIQPATQTIINVLEEVKMHKSFCEEWGISQTELESTPESPATMAYGGYLLDVGLQGDDTKLIIALAACLLGYGEVGLWLMSEASKGENSRVKMERNKYKKWIEDYGGERYQDAVKIGIDILEKIAQDDPPSSKKYNEWKAIWDTCTKLEKNFWDMALALS